MKSWREASGPGGSRSTGRSGRPTYHVFALAAPSFRDRRAAIDRLRDYLKLGELRSTEFEHADVMANARGDIQYFHASGAVLARDATADREHANELRKWEGVQDSKTGGNRVTLNADASKRLIAQAQAIRP